VCAQAGNAATGAFDASEPIADACATHNAWLHIDGAFGLWATVAPATRHLTRGVERADSWAVDAHKWLNVPYDCGMAIVADPAAHVAAMSLTSPYLVDLVADRGQRDNHNYVPESSRRARAVPVYAAIRSLGRTGIAELIERNCAQARRMAERLAAIPGATILNDVVLNQVLVRLPGGDTRQSGRAGRHLARRNLLGGRHDVAGTSPGGGGPSGSFIALVGWLNEASADSAVSCVAR
jgi:glutamate/tyrosine decarboxylase-like PLP-dependent enzyme